MASELTIRPTAEGKRIRFHPATGVSGVTTEPELQPRKERVPLASTRLNLGAPAPQCPSARTSKPSSVIVMLSAPSITTPPDAFVAVGPLFCRTRPRLEAPVSGRPC